MIGMFYTAVTAVDSLVVDIHERPENQSQHWRKLHTHNNFVFWPRVTKQIGAYILDGEVLSGIFCRPINYNEIIFLYKFLTNATQNNGKMLMSIIAEYC